MTLGKFVLRAGEKLHGRLKEYACKRGLSLNSACIELLESALSLQRVKDGDGKGLPFGLAGFLSSQSSLAHDVIGIVLYGSWARGTATEVSDIDVLLVLHQERPITRALYREVDAVTGIEPRVSVMLSHLPLAEERIGTLWLEVAQDGMVLFDRDHQLNRKLIEIRSEIAAGRVTRRQSHGQGYWVYAQ